VTTKAQLLRTIRRKCLECCCDQPSEVSACSSGSCPLWPLYGPGKTLTRLAWAKTLLHSVQMQKLWGMCDGAVHLDRFARRFLRLSGSTILSSDVQATMNRHKDRSPTKASAPDRKTKLPKSPLPTRVAVRPYNSHAITNKKATAAPRQKFAISFRRSLWMRRLRLVFSLRAMCVSIANNGLLQVINQKPSTHMLNAWG
jgi:hypothetical protein